jgi:hypothetical protein
MSYRDSLESKPEVRGRLLDSVARSTRSWELRHRARGNEGAHTATVLKIAAECLEWAADEHRNDGDVGRAGPRTT